MTPRRIIFLSVILLMLSYTKTAWGEAIGTETYLQELIRISREKKLHESRIWRLLLHYERGIFGREFSMAAGSGFFLSPQGRENPQKELEATLTHFFNDTPLSSSQQTAQCTFVARYEWLRSELVFNDQRLLRQRCERFEAWINTLNPSSITLIFPSAYMNNPSSMFGHTLLRIDGKEQTEETRILDYTINYAAEVTTENGILFALFGITGGFQGRFSTIPYYIKVQTYGDIESRDIWEYRLNFTEQQIRRMLMHAWELGNTYFDYYFFKRNCSYELLVLLEIANPDLHLTDSFWLWTIPSDTVRIVTEQPGLVVEKRYRPSRSTQIRRQRAVLSGGEDQLVRMIVQDHSDQAISRTMDLPPERSAAVLDTASDYLQYLSRRGDDSARSLKKMKRKLLQARSRLDTDEVFPEFPASLAPPELGHGTGRIGLGIGWTQDGLIEELSARAGYHSLMDNDTGYTQGAEIEALKLKIRHDHHRKEVYLEHLTLVGIQSLFPMDALFKQPSWKVSLSVETFQNAAGDRRNYVDFNTGGGGAFSPPWAKNGIFYMLLELDANAGSVFERKHRVGGGGTVGILTDVWNRWKAHLFLTSIWYPLGDLSRELSASFQINYSPSKDTAIRLEHDRRENQRQSLLTLHIYF